MPTSTLSPARKTHFVAAGTSLSSMAFILRTPPTRRHVSQKQQGEADQRTNGDEAVAPLYIKGLLIIRARDRPRPHLLPVLPGGVEHAPAPVDARRQPRVRHAQERSARLDGAEDGVRHVLAQDGGV